MISLAPVLVGALVISACSSTPSRPVPATAEAGRSVANSVGCAGCHGADGRGVVGPAWIGLYGSTVQLSDGTSVTADTAYIERSILHPGAQVVKGFPNVMPATPLTPDQVAALVAYIVSLGHR
jgi:cytochrome c oxidase subunit 2